MDDGKPQVDSAVAIEILRRAITICALIWILPPLVYFAFSGGEWQLFTEVLLGMLVIASQLLVIGLIASAVFSVSGEFPEEWNLSVDVWILAGLVAGLCLVALLLSWSAPSELTMPWPWARLFGPVMGVGERFGNWLLSAGVIGVALALCMWVRARRRWRWPGAGVGHVLAAAAMFLYGGLLSTIAIWRYWPLGLVVGSASAYGVCYALGLVTLRVDEFEAACRPDAEPRAKPSVRLTLLLLLLTVGAAVVLALIVPWNEIVQWRRPHVIF